MVLFLMRTQSKQHVAEIEQELKLQEEFSDIVQNLLADGVKVHDSP